MKRAFTALIEKDPAQEMYGILRNCCAEPSFLWEERNAQSEDVKRTGTEMSHSDEDCDGAEGY
jgi:hypothetical protein